MHMHMCRACAGEAGGAAARDRARGGKGTCAARAAGVHIMHVLHTVVIRTSHVPSWHPHATTLHIHSRFLEGTCPYHHHQQQQQFPLPTHAAPFHIQAVCACPYQQQYHQQQVPPPVQVSWRRCFVDALQPSRLPQGWSVEHAASSLHPAAGAGGGAWQGVHERLTASSDRRDSWSLVAS
eukprot:scaffold95791_cov55-Phaeocystis_antarctica.AAC.1